MPKKQAPNAFYFFMRDWKKRQEKAGRTFPNGMRDVQTDSKCSEEWNSLTKAQKSVYESAAKDAKIAMKEAVKKTGVGESISAVEREAKERQAFIEQMNVFIEQHVDHYNRTEGLRNLKVYFIHLNWLCCRVLEDKSHSYHPAEFAVGRFSLENGIEDFRHSLIWMKLPLGMTREALEISQQSHKLPCEVPSGVEESRYDEIYDTLYSFMKEDIKNGIMPFLYTAKAVEEPVKCFLRNACRAVGKPNDHFIVYHLETLFLYIQNAAAEAKKKPAMTAVIAEYELAKDVFSFTPGIECQFHQKIDNTSQFCSLSIIRQWAFTFCDHCCENLDIELRPGINCPKNYQLGGVYALTEGIDNMSLASQPKIMSMTGVSEDHRMKASGRTYKEDQERRKKSKPVEIIDHSEIKKKPIPTVNPTTKLQRPLRIPNTKSYAFVSNDDTVFDKEFPPIGGRGLPRKNATENPFPAFGRGRGKP